MTKARPAGMTCGRAIFIMIGLCRHISMHLNDGNDGIMLCFYILLSQLLSVLRLAVIIMSAE